MKFPRYILYPFLLPTDLFGWLLLCLLHVFWGKSLTWNDGVLVMEFADGSWPARTVYAKWGGSTVGHAIVIGAGMRADLVADTLVHERVHVEQHETNALAGFALALVVLPWSWIGALLIWSLAPWAVYGAGYITALCYGRDAYRGNPAERAAYDRAHVVSEG